MKNKWYQLWMVGSGVVSGLMMMWIWRGIEERIIQTIKLIGTLF